MSERVNPNLLLELEDYGAVGAEICFNCGMCTAMCPLTDDEHPFPRNMIRLAQLGLTDRLLANTDPWLCYYCGDCAETCPRQAEPGETMPPTLVVRSGVRIIASFPARRHRSSVRRLCLRRPR